MDPYEQGFLNNATAPPAEQAMQMPMSMNDQMVPNVMMDMPDEKMQQQNVNVGFMHPNQAGYTNGIPQQQTETYDLNAPPFDIEDPLMRRQFFRKVFFILLIQNILALPVMEVFILCTNGPLNFTIYYSYCLFGFLIFILMYVFSDYRRHAPVNTIALIFTTLFLTIQEGIYATFVGTAIAFTSQLIVIAEFLAIIAYSKQTRFRFNNINAIFLSFFMYLIAYAIIGVLSPKYLYGVKMISAFNVVYCVYDAQLQLSGHHGYNLKAEEHIFGAVNIYADIPNLIWRFFRYIFLDHFVRIYQFFQKCCFAEVC